MPLDLMLDYFVAGFYYQGSPWNQVLTSLALAAAFAALWLTPYWMAIFKKPWAWAVLAGSALLTWTAASFIQIPLMYWAGQALDYVFGMEAASRFALLVGIPGLLIGGLVQEGAKLAPVACYWWRSGRRLSPRLGLALGAVAGAGLGIFEATWLHNAILASGWDSTSMLGFTERFFSVALHIGLSAIAGYGLARGWGWQAYLVVAFLHALNNWGGLLLRAGVLSLVGVEIYFAVIAVLVTAAALYIRWKRLPEND